MKSKKNKKGMVYFVGAGPGDPGLITVKGASLVAAADVIIHDLFVHPSLLAMASHAHVIYVGKDLSRKSHAYVNQEKINRLLLRHARAGKKVVRLKGGDPLIFGRGSEEALFLKKNGILFEFVPGVSSGNAVPAYAGIPLTDRSHASLAVFVTGHEDLSKKESAVKWEHLAGLSGTLVLFMGIRNLDAISKILIRFGKRASTCVSVLERGTLPGQRVIEGNLRTIAAKVKKEKVRSPSLVVIGPVNQLRSRLKWYRKKKLSGKSVLITRASGQSSRLRHALELEGAQVYECPAVEILAPRSYVSLDRSIKKIKDYHWVLFTSANAVRSFFKRLSVLKKDVRGLAGIQIAAVGKATADSLAEYGVRADFIPKTYRAEDLVHGLQKKARMQECRFLLPQSDLAGNELKRMLEALGAKADRVEAYRTAVNKKSSGTVCKWLDRQCIDFVALTSASTAHGFLNSLTPKYRKRFSAKTGRQELPKLVSIGPVTSRTLKDAGVRADRTAAKASVAGLVQAMAGNRKR